MDCYINIFASLSSLFYYEYPNCLKANSMKKQTMQVFLILAVK